MRTIYSVEDDLDIEKIIYVSLSKAGYRVLSFATTKAFWEAFEKERPDMVLLDLMLPDGNGIDLLKRLRADRKNNSLKVVILSAKRMTMDKIEGLDSGADDYIEKPFDILELISRINARFRLDSEALTFEDITLDATRHLAEKCGNDLNLTNTEFEIFSFLTKEKQSHARKSPVAYTIKMTPAKAAPSTCMSPS